MEPQKISHQERGNLGDPAPFVALDVLQMSLQEKGALQTNGNYIVDHAKNCARVHVDALSACDEPATPGKILEREQVGARTLMICNLPCRVRYDDVLEAIYSVGFGAPGDGFVEFVHLPFRSWRPDSNLGYCFINFFCPSDAARFAIAFEGYRFNSTRSSKICTVKTAKCQGYNGNYQGLRLHRNRMLADEAL
jgi:hypothetical protein